MARLRIAVVHPFLGYGGSEARALWSLQALRERYELSLITYGSVDVSRLNAYYGTSLESSDFKLVQVFRPWGLRGRHFNALQGHILQRYCQRVASQFDIMISTYNPLSFGVPGIQFVEDFSFAPHLRFRVDPGLQNRKTWWYGDTHLRRAYLGVCNLVSRTDREGFKNDLLVANSQWSAKLFREHFGLEARVLYPPVEDDFPHIPYVQRENGFVCIGRVYPEKRMDAVIRILRGVRQRGHDVHLHILGGLSDSGFGAELRAMAEVHRGWVFLEGRLGGAKKKQMLVRHRFGIHGRTNEPFGIAVAEMVEAGCTVFVPDGGGQTEIVDHPRLTYSDDEMAVEKIDAVLRSADMQATLRKHLKSGARRFSVDKFQKGLLELVREYIGGQPYEQPMPASHRQSSVGKER